MDRGRAMGVGRWSTVFGTMAVGGGLFVGVAALSWVGVGVAGLGLAAVTATKFVHYRALDVPRERWVGVWVAWLALAATLAALLADYTYARLTTGYEGAFWILVVASGGFWAVYWGLRTKWVPVDATADDR